MTSQQILLVEDNQQHRSMLSSGLVGLQMRIVTNSESAYDKLSNWNNDPFDLVVLDVQIPVRNGEEASVAEGVELLKSIKQLPSPPPVIAISAHLLHPSHRSAVEELGVEKIYDKPFLIDSLATHVQKLLSELKLDDE